ncbi:MAG: hypothetical protein QOE36_1491, partial [Gaiellaceae bacterium]|nr:hypothetical protein [Gaiellaceae bacterium]
DRATVYARKSAERCEAELAKPRYRVAVRLGAGGSSDAPLRFTAPSFVVPCFSFCGATAVRDLDRDGRREVQLTLGTGAATSYNAFFRLAGLRLVPIGTARSPARPVVFVRGGHADFWNGVVCRAPNLVLSYFWERAGAHLKTRMTVYAYNGSVLRLRSITHGTVPAGKLWRPSGRAC